MARKAQGKPLTLRPIRVDEDVWAALRALMAEYKTLNEGLRHILITSDDAPMVCAAAVTKRLSAPFAVEVTDATMIRTLDAVGPKVSDGQGKVAIESWRANRRPLLKPGGNKAV